MRGNPDRSGIQGFLWPALVVLVVSSATPSRGQQAATTPALTTLKGHSDAVASLAFSPDGRTLASGGFDRRIVLWDVASHKAARVLDGHRDPVLALAFAPSGDLLVSTGDLAGPASKSLNALAGTVPLDEKVIPYWGDPTGTVRYWDPSTGAQRTEARHDAPGALAHARYLDLDFMPDGKSFVTGGRNGSVTIWDVATQRARLPLDGHTEPVSAVAVSPDGKWIASASWDRTITLWDAATGSALPSMTGHEGWITSIAFAPSGELLASASWDGSIRLWQVSSRQEVLSMIGHDGPVRSIAFSSQGDWIVSGGFDQTVRLWDVVAGEVEVTLRGHHDVVHAVAFSPDGSIIASASQDRTVRLWDTSRALLNVSDGSP